MRRITTAVDIGASSAEVWRVLADFATYPDWNPFIRRIEGEPRVGARLRVTAQPAGRRSMTFKPTILVAEPERELRWLGRILLPGVFDGEHAFIIEPKHDGCHLRHEESFRGLLVPLFAGMLGDTERAFIAMNDALKRRVEARR
ncbi:MAG: SRPBCC domain-containing protein [Reyranella sp.]|nr:SRPBCC domain-containing protein [Reyranella sp.]